MEDKNSLKRFGDIGFSIIFGIIIISISIYHYKKDSSVTKYRTQTVGKIIDFKRRKSFNYSLKYVYYVDGIKYEGSVGTGNFNCADGTKGCVGKEIKVFYSSKEPKYSQVDLGDYEKHKTTIYLVE